MVETLRYELITREDLAIGASESEQQLADGRVVRLQQIQTGNLHLTQEVNVVATAGEAQLTAMFGNPDGAKIHGVTMMILTTLGNSNGLTSFDLGDSVIIDRWGLALGIVETMESSGADFRIDDEPRVSANYAVLLTQNGGNFDGTGIVQVQLHYSLLRHMS